MGTSFTQFNGFGFWAKDYALKVWLMLLVHEISAMPEPLEWLDEAKEEWRFQATFGATGCVLADLDRFIVDSERKNAIISICQVALAKLNEKGDTLDPIFLNSLGTGGEGSSYLNHIETACFAIVAKKFIELLEGKLKFTARNSPNFSC